ncbi:MAG: DUF4833 domain-containing protein [Prolixibacteraceae bacterium]|nr:DUF4833 domain-containing protein [Prolixibacteraceae bacterium]
MNQVIKVIIFSAVFFVFELVSTASDSENSNSNSLFKIGRSKDANEIFYEVRTTPDGNLNLDEPIKIYWIKYAENSAVEPLTKVQQLFAYGLKFLEVTPEKADFQFVSYAKRTLSLSKNDVGKYVVSTEVDGKNVELERVFLQIDGGTFWFPKISRVEIYAKKAEAGEPVVEIIIP